VETYKGDKMKQGKVWGETELVALVPGVLEFHRIEARKGGVCSKHAHQSKTNGFFVESGRLLIREWQNAYDLVDETILNAGEYCIVPPGVYHQFEVLEDCVAFELYYAELIGDDIVRETVGFVS
jgi:quercetin dioxygenase-like cupin family protein